eukprot:4722778-Prymnesium_polylepis.1
MLMSTERRGGEGRRGRGSGRRGRRSTGCGRHGTSETNWRSPADMPMAAWLSVIVAITVLERINHI